MSDARDAAEAARDAGMDDRRLPRLPALDGIRAFAVLLTSLVHVLPQWVPGGIFGVDIFFVLSGFLITSILLTSSRAVGGIDLKQFYVRRVRRLLPAVVLLLMVFTAVVVLSRPTERELLVAGVVDVSVLAYVFNWSDVFGHQPPWQVDHLWSLSVEEQFYLLWPLVLVFALGRLSRRQIVAATLAGVAITSLAQGWTYLASRSTAWAYLSTPLHAQGILLGCLLAELYVWGRAERPLRWLAGREWPAWAGLALLVGLALGTGVDDTFTYTGGMLLAVLAAALVVACMVAHDTFAAPGRLRRFFSSRLMVALGQRSYSLYLWQNFFAWALTPVRHTLLFVPANLAATLVAAEISYRFVERRFLARPARQASPSVTASANRLRAVE